MNKKLVGSTKSIIFRQRNLLFRLTTQRSIGFRTNFIFDVTNYRNNLNQQNDLKKILCHPKHHFSTYPSHTVVPMPALSPTMESGSISSWQLKEGDRFDAGIAICEVETDKATVTYEATEEGFIAKILVGSGEVKVGQPLMITVDKSEYVAAFTNYSTDLSAVVSAPAASPIPSKPAAPVVVTTAEVPTPPAAATSSTISIEKGSRVFASPLAKKLARDMGVHLSHVSGTGPNGRIISFDVLSAPKAAAQPSVSTTTAQSVTSPTQPTTTASKPAKASPTVSVPGLYTEFELSDLASAVASRFVMSKQAVPHYYLTVELNMSKLLQLRAQLNKDLKAEEALGVTDFVVKAAALAMSQVPDVNGSWMETFVRRYHQVDINLVMGTAEGLVTPVIKDVGAKGLRQIAKELAVLEETLFAEQGGEVNAALLQPGTFSIHNLGAFGIKSAAPIVLPPQSCALAMGAIIDCVVPADGDQNWQVAPMMSVTLSCDHRVVDGAVGAQWLAALKNYVENPMNMIL